MPAPRRRTPLLAAAAAVALLAGCATLQQLVQPLEFSRAPGRFAELRILPPSSQLRLGGIGVRLWAHVENPNAIGVNLTRVAGTLLLQNTRAGDVDLPLGLPLTARADTVIPLDISIGFGNVPGLAQALQGVVTGASVPYRLDGKFTVDAGALGPFEFGPETLLSGDLEVRGR